MRSYLPLALALFACGPSEAPLEPSDATTASSSPPPAALLPSVRGVHAPSLAELPQGGPVDGSYLADVDSCGACHPDVLAQQQASAHAFASFNNPVYRLSVEKLRKEIGNEASLMCAGCHDAALLVDGAMAGAVDASDPRAHNGVSCRLCHGIAHATRDGNGSYQLRAEPLPLPTTGDAQSLARHKAAAKPPELASLCGSCHQSFLSEATGNQDVLLGQNELVAWADSAYSGAGASRIDTVTPKTCVQCHMAKVATEHNDAAADAEGKVSSHYFLGAHTWLAAMRGDKAQEGRASEFLSGVATIDAISYAPEAGRGELVVDIVVRNTGVGHRFPSGVRDAANTWIEVEVLGPKGESLLRSESGLDQHRLTAYVADQEGRILHERETHQFASLVVDHTIAPRDAVVTRYRGAMGNEGRDAKKIHARLLHQSRGQGLALASCKEAKSPRGRSYAKAGRDLAREVLDPCVPMPTTVIAEVTRDLGDAGDTDFDRSYEHGLALLHEVQERVDSARPSLQRALVLAGEDTKKQSMVLLAIAKLDGRLGRADEAIATLRKVQELAPQSAAAYVAEGDVLARVWRWAPAAKAYGKASGLVQGNADVWRNYAIALGSAGEAWEALQAAQRGLRLLPRDPDLLRVQALALETLQASDAAAAMEAYLENRGPDNTGTHRLRCVQASELCARESMPVHEHLLVNSKAR